MSKQNYTQTERCYSDTLQVNGNDMPTTLRHAETQMCKSNCAVMVYTFNLSIPETEADRSL